MLDVGCGLGSEVGYLASAGWQAGSDLSEVTIARAAAGQDDAAFMRADACQLPFRPHCSDAAIDRAASTTFPRQTARGTPMNSGACSGQAASCCSGPALRTAGARNDMNEAVISRAFAAWQTGRMERAAVPSDTRMLEVIIARLSPTRPT